MRGKLTARNRVAALLTSFMLVGSVIAQEEDARATKAPASTAWFGVAVPPKAFVETAVMVGARAPRPVVLAAAEPRTPEFDGATIRKDLATIVAFSTESRKNREVGSGQLWGRISGFPSSDKTIEWSLRQFRDAGLTDIRSQPIEQESRSSLWLPLSWEVRLLGSEAFGAGTKDVVLESALPLAPSTIPGESMTAPLVYVGAASSSVIRHIDVKGKIAVQLVIPQGHMVFERSAVSARTQELTKRGAVAVLNLVRLPGNELARDFGNCGGPCFNIGGRDGWFLENMLDRAAQAGAEVRAQLAVKSTAATGLKARNGVGVVRGKSEETIVIDGHVDAWFDGAGDNADGLAVMIALARHFAKPQNKPDRTLVFVASAGHHTPGINGPRSFVAANPEWVSKAVMTINIEHVAQRNFSPARSTAPDGYRHAVADSGEAPITFGVTNQSPYINELAQQGVARYGVNFVSEPSGMQSGETGGFSAVPGAKITIMQAPPLYHTTGETSDVISTPGLERMARFLAYFIKEAAKAPKEKLNP